MNYYPHHIGDYAKDASHLTMIEDGAYRRMMDTYYSTERPLPLDRAALYRLVRALSKAERGAVDAVLQEFFQQNSDGWHSKRCDEEIAKAKEKSRKAADSAREGWSKRNANADADAMRTHSGTKAKAMLPITNNQEPITKSHVTPSPATTVAGVPKPPVSPCSHEAIIDLYHRVLPELPQVAKWTDTRKGYLQSRWREDKRHQTLDWWERFFRFVKESDFLCGRAKPQPGKKPFTADLEWIVTQGNFVKILERKYHE
jgi:uncharacterized protein YdaU (DUF1376 family)